MLVLECCTHHVSCVQQVPQDVCTVRARLNTSEVPLTHVYGILIVIVYCGVPGFDVVKHAECCY